MGRTIPGDPWDSGSVPPSASADTIDKKAPGGDPEQATQGMP
jgi:hypothetical protein